MNTNTLLLLAIGIGGYLYLTRKPDRKGKQEYLVSWLIGSGGQQGEVTSFTTKLNAMNDAEVDTVYEYIHDWYAKGKNLVQGSDLYNRVMLISNKYEIFT